MQEKTDLISIHVDVHRLRKTAPSQKPSIISCTIAKNVMTPPSPFLWTSEAYIKNLTLDVNLNWENLCPHFSLTVEKKKWDLHA